MLRIAICDDDKEIRNALQDAVRAYPHSCCVDLYSDGMSLLKERKNFDIIFLDIGMAKMDGDVIPFSQKKSTEFRECLGRYLAEHI